MGDKYPKETSNGDKPVAKEVILPMACVHSK